MILQADIIVKKSGERLEDVHIKSFSGSEIIYTPEDGDVTVLMKSDISAILYDDGRYEEFNQTSETPYENDMSHQYTSESKTPESEPMEEYYPQQNNKVDNGEEYLGEYEEESIESINNQESQSGYALEPEAEPEPIQKRDIEFRASKSFIEFTETGGETRIEIISDEAWEVAEMPSWVDTRQKSDALIIHVAQNERTSDREGDVVLLNKHQTELRIVVAQGKNNDYLKLSAPGIDDTEGVGGAYTIKVNSNKAWDAKTDADWCTIEKREENFVVRLASNMSGQKREATIEVTASQSVISKQVFWVKQSPLNHYIFINPSSVTSKGGKSIITINVTTDMPKYRIEEIPDWCNISQMNANSFILEIADNSGGAAREAQIKVAVDGGKSKILTVQQEERLNYVSVSPKIVTASPRGGIITINVEGSGAWRVVNLPDWCQTTDQTDDSFTLIIEKNDTDAPRNASFSVSVSGVREQIEVRQQ